MQRRGQHGDHLIGELVHDMDTAAVDIEHNIVSVQLILMNHQTHSRFIFDKENCL